MKRVLFILILTLVLVLTGCGNTDALEAQVADLQQQIARLEAENEALRAQLEATAPIEEAPQEEAPATYAELSIFDWSQEDNILAITGAYARVINLPTVGGQPEMPENCTLVITLNDGEIYTQVLELLPGEADNSLERQIDAFQAEIPELAEGDIVEAYLEVTLAEGSLLTGWGCGWDYEEGALVMTAG